MGRSNISSPFGHVFAISSSYLWMHFLDAPSLKPFATLSQLPRGKKIVFLSISKLGGPFSAANHRNDPPNHRFHVADFGCSNSTLAASSQLALRGLRRQRRLGDMSLGWGWDPTAEMEAENTRLLKDKTQGIYRQYRQKWEEWKSIAYILGLP